MTFELFKLKMMERLQEKLEGSNLKDDFRLCVENIEMNNGVVNHAVCLRKVGGAVYASPVDYLERYYYENYPLDVALEHDAELIWMLISKDTITFDTDVAYDFEKIKNNIRVMVINTEMNSERLKDMPHKDFLDLSIVAYIILEEYSDGYMNTAVTNEWLKRWNKTADEIISLGFKNTVMCFKPVFKDILDVLYENEDEEGIEKINKQLVKNDKGEIDRLPLYILSNSHRVYGAITMLYPVIMDCLVDQFSSNLLIIPSSVHEVLVLPCDKDMDLEATVEMVRLVNRTEVPLRDVLSNCVYLVRKKDGVLTFTLVDDSKSKK